MQVRAKVTHTQPGTLIYRAEGDVFQHTGKLYEHVEKFESRAKQVVEDVEESVGEAAGEAFEQR